MQSIRASPSQESATNRSVKQGIDQTKYDRFSMSKKIEVTKPEDLFSNKNLIAGRDSLSSIDEDRILNRYNEVTKQLKKFYESFLDYAMTKEIKNKIVSLKEQNEEDPIWMLKYATHVLKLLDDIRKRELEHAEQVLQRKIELDDYEFLLQKAEIDIKNHIRTEEELKLLVNSLTEKVEKYERNKGNLATNTINMLREVQTDNTDLIDMLKVKEQEVESLAKVLKQKDEVIKSYEERVLTITILDHKLKSLQEKHAREKEAMRKLYTEFQNMSKEFQDITQILRGNLDNQEKVILLQNEVARFHSFSMKKIQKLEDELKEDEDLREQIAEFDSTERFSKILSETKTARGSESVRKDLTNTKSNVIARKYL